MNPIQINLGRIFDLCGKIYYKGSNNPNDLKIVHIAGKLLEITKDIPDQHLVESLEKNGQLDTVIQLIEQIDMILKKSEEKTPG